MILSQKVAKAWAKRADDLENNIHIHGSEAHVKSTNSITIYFEINEVGRRHWNGRYIRKQKNDGEEMIDVVAGDRIEAP